MSGSTLITEVMSNWVEATLIFASLSFSLFHLFSNKIRKKSFSLERCKINISRNFMTIYKLYSHEAWKSDEEGETPWGELFLHGNIVYGELLCKV